MKFRNHPLISRYGIRTWPPVWSWIGLTENHHPAGEVGILKEVALDRELGRCFLTIEYEKERYMGCLFINDRAFCEQLEIMLGQHVGETIAQIGDLDVSDFPSE